MNSYLRKNTSILKNISAQKFNTAVTASSTTKILFTGKDTHTIAIHHIKDVNKTPWQKYDCFDRLQTALFYALE